MKIAYVVDSWPRLSETFVVREIAGAALRHAVRVVALERGDVSGPADPAAEDLADRVVWLAPTSGAAPRRAALLHGAHRPARWARALGAARRAREEGTLRRFPALVDVSRDLSRWGVERIHAHFARWSTAAAEVISAWTGAPFGFTAHAYDLFRSPVRLKDKAERAAWAVTCTEAGRAEIERVHGPAVAARFHVIRHGLDLEAYSPGPPRARAAALHVLAVGRLVRKKGFDLLVEALRRLARDPADYLTLVVGDGEESDALVAASMAANVGHRVRFAGALHPSAVREALRTWADVLVAPSRIDASGDRDGLPNVVGEAMACGVPVIGTPVGGLPEMLVDGTTGVLVPPEDPAALAEALARLAHDRELRARLGRGAREMAERVFDARVNLRALLALVETGGRRA